MPRRREVPKRIILPDPKFGSLQIAKFVNMIMRGGKKSTAESIMYNALDRITEKAEGEATEVMEQALENVKPMVEVKSRRVGGATYQVPTEISRSRQLALALRWLVQFAKGRRGMPMKRAVAIELLDAYNNQGSVVKKREDTHKMAQANKAFAHYAW